MAQLDYRKMGFTMSVAEAAEALEVEPFEVRNLLLTNDLAGVIVSAGQFAAITVALHPDEVRAYAMSRKTRAETVDSRNRFRVLSLLHTYLRDNPAVDDYDRATLEGVPLLACSGTELMTHVRLEAIADYGERLELGTFTTSMVAEALTRAGGVRRKGLIAAADRGPKAKQRWGVWWRIPEALLTSATEETVVRQLVNGPLAEGEKVRVGEGGELFLAEKISENE